MRIAKSKNNNYDLSSREKQLFLECIKFDPCLSSDINRHIVIDAAEIESRYGLALKTAYDELRQLGEKIFGLTHTIQNPQSGAVERIRWVSKVKYVQPYIELHFSPEIMPLLSELLKAYALHSSESVGSATTRMQCLMPGG